MKTKTCCSCKKEKILDKFYKHRHAKYGRQAQCISCFKKINKNYDYSNVNRSEMSEVSKKRNNERQRKRYKEDIDFKLKMLYRNRIYYALKDNIKSDTTENLLGCSIEDLKQHLEEQFDEEMNWDNYGEWHVDHIKPCASFDFSKEEQQKKCFNYSNLQPLWAVDNFKKSDRV